MTDVPWMDWYQSLAKPSWTPAPRTIGLIWQVLYPVILASFGFVFVQAGRGKLSWSVALPFAINLVANLLFTPIQFGLRNLPLASVDILVVWGTILWMLLAIVAAVDPDLHPLRQEAEQVLKRVKPTQILITFLEVAVDATRNPPQAAADVVVRVAGNVIETGTPGEMLAEFRVLLHKKDGTWLIRDVEADRTRLGQLK